MMCSADDDVAASCRDLVDGVFCGLWSVWKEVEVLKKLKLAIFGVQAKSSVNNFFHSFKKNTSAIWRAHTQLSPLSQPAILESWRQKVVEAHLPLLHELIKFPEAKCSHHQLANNHVAGSTCRTAAILRRLQQYSPVHIAAAPSSLTSSF
eukprot:scaffold33451_cov72-Skeletonema_dohrnii-CCMP3373.AAC.1